MVVAGIGASGVHYRGPGGGLGGTAGPRIGPETRDRLCGIKLEGVWGGVSGGSHGGPLIQI